MMNNTPTALLVDFDGATAAPGPLPAPQPLQASSEKHPTVPRHEPNTQYTLRIDYYEAYEIDYAKRRVLELGSRPAFVGEVPVAAPAIAIDEDKRRGYEWTIRDGFVVRVPDRIKWNETNLWGVCDGNRLSLPFFKRPATMSTQALRLARAPVLLAIILLLFWAAVRLAGSFIGAMFSVFGIMMCRLFMCYIRVMALEGYPLGWLLSKIVPFYF